MNACKHKVSICWELAHFGRLKLCPKVCILLWFGRNPISRIFPRFNCQRLKRERRVATDLEMSQFVALNLYEEDLVHAAEEQTRELQIEEALKLYQEALRDQNEHKNEEAHKKYQALFEFHVINSLDLEGLPQSAFTLRHLVYKNHALLLLSELKYEYPTLDNLELVERTNDIFIELFDALHYDSSDARFLETVAAFADAAGYKAVARACLEAIVYAPDRPVSIEDSLLAGSFLSPQERRIVEEYRTLLMSIGDTINLNQAIFVKETDLIAKISPHESFGWLPTAAVNNMDKLLVSEESHQVEITIQDSWLGLMKAIDHYLIKENKKAAASTSLAYSGQFDQLGVAGNAKEHACVSSIQLSFKFVVAKDKDGFKSEKESPELSAIADEEAMNGSQSAKEALGLEPISEQGNIEGTPTPIENTTGSASVLNTPSHSDVIVSNSGEKDFGDNNEMDAQGVDGEGQQPEEPLSEAPSTGTPATPQSINVSSITNAVEQHQRSSKRTPLDDANSMRSSKRMKRDDINPDTQYLKVENFFEQMSIFLAPAGESFNNIVHVLKGESHAPEDQYLVDFRELLNQWNFSYTEMFLNKRGMKQKSESLMQILDTAMLGGTSNTIENSSSPTVSPSVEDFIHEANTESYNLYDLKPLVIKKLLGPSEGHAGTYFTKSFWPESLLPTVLRCVLSIESQLFQLLKEFVLVPSPNAQHVEEALFISAGIYEMLVNQHLANLKLKTAVKDHQSVSKDQQQLAKDQDAKLFGKLIDRNMLNRWRTLTGDILYSSENSLSSQSVEHLKIRCAWISIFAEQGVDSFQHNSEAFANIADQLPNGFLSSFPNSPNIPQCSEEGVKVQTSKFKTSSVFEGIFKAAEDRQNILFPPLVPKSKSKSKPSSKKKDTNGTTTVEPPAEPSPAEAINEKEKSLSKEERLTANAMSVIPVLEAILINGEPDDPKYHAILQFFNNSSIGFKLQLWYQLFDAYEDIGECNQSFQGYLKLLISAIESFIEPQFATNSPQQRYTILVKALFVAADIGKKVLSLILEDRTLLNVIHKEQKTSLYRNILCLVRLLHIHVYLESQDYSGVESAQVGWPSLRDRFHDLIAVSWCLCYIFFKESLGDVPKRNEHLNDALSCVHEEISGYCCAGDGVLLDLSLQELVKIPYSISETDLLQCMHCRYGQTLSNEWFSPYPHSTEPIPITKDAVLLLLPFLMDFTSRRKSFAQDIMKKELKGVLDSCWLQLKETNASDDLNVSYNLGILDRFFESQILPSMLKLAVNGKFSLPFVEVDGPQSQVGKSGFYFVMGTAQHALFKIRKRANSAKVEDITEMINFFKADIAYNPRRVESWLGLAQAFDALVEDALIISADTVSIASKKQSVASNYSRAILASIMAVNFLIGRRPAEGVFNKGLFRHVSLSMWEFIARLLYGACRPPMAMLPFASGTSSFRFGAKGLYLDRHDKGLDQKSVMRLSLQINSIAIKENPSDWSNYYLKSKILYRLGADFQEVLTALLDAVSLAGRERSSEPVIEPHYKLVSMVYKYVIKGAINPDAGLLLLQKTPYFDTAVLGVDMEPSPLNKFGVSCLATLQKLRVADKKKWQHRTVYRISQILFETFRNYFRAKEEMKVLFYLKTQGKVLIQFWKPESERPGQHFLFAHRYIVYFIQLLEATLSLDELGILCTKLRRYSSNVTDHLKTWEFACVAISRATKAYLQLPPKFSDNVIATLVYEEFNQQAEAVQNLILQGSRKPEYSDLLGTAIDVRRLNNGFGSTAPVDEMVISVYLKIFLTFYERIVNNTPTAAGTFGVAAAPATPTPLAGTRTVPGVQVFSQKSLTPAMWQQTMSKLTVSSAPTSGIQSQAGTPPPSAMTPTANGSEGQNTGSRISVNDLLLAESNNGVQRTPSPGPTDSHTSSAPLISSPPPRLEHSSSVNNTPIKSTSPHPTNGSSNARNKIRVTRRDVIGKAVVLGKEIAAKFDSPS